MQILEPLTLGARTAPNRILFGPHVTNLGDGRALSDRHVAYYARRAAGGAGIIVIEEASVDDSDWPYERAPLAVSAPSGWARIVDACHRHTPAPLVLAALGHSGGQGSSAYHQRPLLAPSRVPEVSTREVPKWMEESDIEAVVAAFAQSARLAVEAGCDGVEVNAGQHSLVRQFLSGLTNHRDDAWGRDRSAFARRVLAEIRATVGPGAIVGLRLSADELAPWAGITPEQAPDLAVGLCEHIDYLVVVRGSIFSTDKTRPDAHEAATFNLALTRAVRAVVPPHVAIVLQGSVVDPRDAQQALADGAADAVEMTRAQIADPDLGVKLARGEIDRVRPCVRCNQTCQVRDARNPVVTCIGEPTSGHETDDPDWYAAASPPRRVLVVGGGPAGLEAARVAAVRGHHVRLVDAAGHLGGSVRLAAAMPGHEPIALLVDWLEREARHAGVEILEATVRSDADLRLLTGAPPDVVVIATGARDADEPSYTVEPGATVVSSARWFAARADGGDPLDGADGPVVVWDPVGGPIGVAAAEAARADGHEVVLVTPDQIAGNELSRTGDLAPANVRLQQAGVAIERRALLRAVAPGRVEVEDRFSGTRRFVPAAVVVDAGHRQPDDALWNALAGRAIRIGDAIAPRTVLEAVLEGRRAALAVDTTYDARP